jgi:2-amino-4-hydroxy-6-hydroxymethyldihydropteridine diphosphokinase
MTCSITLSASVCGICQKAAAPKIATVLMCPVRPKRRSGDHAQAKEVGMARAFIGVGSNIEPAKNVQAAIRLLTARARIVAISTVYSTEPEGRPCQPPFYNCVVEIRTDAPPAVLKEELLRRIEADLGRVRTEDRFAPRPIDLDLILYDDLVLETDDITLPAPEIAHRSFLVMALCELAPELVLPGSHLPLTRPRCRAEPWRIGSGVEGSLCMETRSVSVLCSCFWWWRAGSSRCS